MIIDDPSRKSLIKRAFAEDRRRCADGVDTGKENVGKCWGQWIGYHLAEMAFPVHCAHALEVDLGDLDETRGLVDRLVELGVR